MVDSFFNFVAKTTAGCWEWTGSRHEQGYGRYRQGDRIAKAHRVSYEIHKGPIPDGLFVLHRCDNPACVNPDHLFLGTHDDNMADMVAKGRARTNKRSGLLNPAAKITPAEAEEIRRLRGRATQAQIARRFGVSQQLVSCIQTGKNWA